MAYSEFQFWSPIRDCNCIRISMCNNRSEEFFCIVPVQEGKSYRQTREAALDMIQSAIDAGLDPGEVVPISPALLQFDLGLQRLT